MITTQNLLPLQQIPKGERKEFAEYKLDQLISEAEFHIDRKDTNLVAGNYYSRKSRNAYCRKVWNNTSESTDFDYLYRKVEKEIEDPVTNDKTVIELTPPARVRHIPIVRPKLQSLISRMADRPFNPRVYSVSTEQVEEKLERHLDAIALLRSDKLKQRMIGNALMMRGLAMQEQLLQQLGQADAEAQQQGQQADPRIAEMIPQLQAAIEQAKMMASKSVRIEAEEREKIANFYKYSYRDQYEQATEGMLFEYIRRNRLKELRQKGFEEKMITDETYYLVWWEEGMLEPSTTLVRPEHVAYPIVDNKMDTRELDWCVIYEPQLYGSIVEKHGHQLTNEQVLDLRNDVMQYDHSSNAWMPILPDGRRMYSSEYDEMMRRSSISTYRAFWKEVVKVSAIEHEDENGEKWYELVDGKYKKKDGEKIVTRFKTELWSGLRIGDKCKFYVDVRKTLWQPRPIGQPSSVYLPLIGKSVSKYHQPNSLVWTTRDIQEMYNILHYHEELLLALAGVKGIVYDISQMPEGMSTAELIYMMKNGLLLIQTIGEHGRKNSTFNQYQTYDQSISPAISYITNIKASLVELVSMITGVTAQQQGQVVQTDQVGTYQMGLAMSNASVEIYYQEDEYIWQQVSETLCNLFPLVYRQKGTRKIYFDGTKQQIVSYPKGMDGEFAAVVSSGKDGQQALEQAKGAIQAAYQKGVVSISQLLQMQDLQSIHDIRVSLKDFEDKAQQMAQGSQQQQQQMAMEMQQQAKQMDSQMAMQMEQVKGQMAERLEMIKGQIEMQKEQLKAGLQQADIVAKKEIATMQDATKRYDVETNTMIEASYLQLEKQKLENDIATSRLEGMMNMMESRLKANDAKKSKGKGKD